MENPEVGEHLNTRLRRSEDIYTNIQTDKKYQLSYKHLLLTTSVTHHIPSWQEQAQHVMNTKYTVICQAWIEWTESSFPRSFKIILPSLISFF